ncbi:MAG TPA: hypothetical protein PK358_02265 [Spirochaetota bacterium]|nr:hypothetical protein [Spirochaetota bacterium]HPJ33630.1 hypothetical protein [Spirochaetota bacterium]
MNVETLIKKRDELRKEWKEIRNSRFIYKGKLSSSASHGKSIKRDRKYIELKKRQAHLSKMIKHIERDIIRRINGKRV